MQKAGKLLEGKHDFSSFRALACQSRTPVRYVYGIVVSRQGEYIYLDVQANGFLHHMVRNIAGSLIAVGSGRRPPGWCSELLSGRDRTLAADTAEPDGLYLVDVQYPDEYALPPTPYGPLLLAGKGEGGT